MCHFVRLSVTPTQIAVCECSSSFYLLYHISSYCFTFNAAQHQSKIRQKEHFHINTTFLLDKTNYYRFACYARRPKLKLTLQQIKENEPDIREMFCHLSAVWNIPTLTNISLSWRISPWTGLKATPWNRISPSITNSEWKTAHMKGKPFCMCFHISARVWLWFSSPGSSCVLWVRLQKARSWQSPMWTSWICQRSDRGCWKHNISLTARVRTARTESKMTWRLGEGKRTESRLVFACLQFN